MTRMLRFLLLLLFPLITSTKPTEIDVNGVAIDDYLAANGSLDAVEVLIQDEAQVVNTLVKLDKQLDEALDHLSSGSGALEVDIVIGQLDGTKSGSKLWIADEIIVEIPNTRLSEEKKDEIKEQIESNVADTLDAMVIDEMAPPKMEKGIGDKVERLFEEEAEVEKELEEMKLELDKALDELPNEGSLAEIDIVVSLIDGEDEIVEDEIIAIIPASTGSGPILSEEKKEQLEEEIVMEAAAAMGAIILDDFIDDQVPENAESQPPDAPLLERESAREKSAQAAWGAKAALRGAATTTTHTGFEHPMFVPHHWQTNDDQLWTMKLSMLTSMSCLTLLLIVGVWTGVRRSRRPAVLDDSHFRWAEAVEYMDAFPYDQ
ncbi:hypothetical protein GN244_ATG07960 [Phytophthora infestans]|uniref:Uncharacterized protein n=1 Tax=Phytophthora infestans TaxID=4787 RepID=A0A833S3T2_PHYIN|nr:hypothetical protein GN244_ATG07960 [Phytophthora infestans]